MRVLLKGGLGNQMFQYAFAKAYEITNSKNVELDTSFLDFRAAKNNHTLRNFELNTFKTTLPVVSNKRTRFNSFLLKLMFKIKTLLKPEYYIIETLVPYSSEYLSNKKATYADGYFQSEKYFIHIRDTLLKEFTFKESMDERNLELANQMQNKNSISLHVRRGDYLIAGSGLHVCSLGYYNAAIKLIADQFPNPTIYVFSDDLTWAKENIQPQYEIHFLDHNKGRDSFKDMFLMSQCKHNVIANSSFSWWGAWLNKNPNKITVAPLNWYTTEVNSPKNDIYGKNWIVL